MDQPRYIVLVLPTLLLQLGEEGGLEGGVEEATELVQPHPRLLCVSSVRLSARLLLLGCRVRLYACTRGREVLLLLLGVGQELAGQAGGADLGQQPPLQVLDIPHRLL